MFREFNYPRTKPRMLQASEPLATILDYIKYGFMIDNVVLIMAGAVSGRSFAVCTIKLYDTFEFHERAGT